MKKALLPLLLLLAVTLSAQNQSKPPKLFVGIVVDQMRVDYLYRFEDKFSDGGFKRLIKDGFFGKNTHYNYVPTYTGPGHASVFSGSTPSVHGIIGNDWYVRELDKKINCVADSLAYTVGIEASQKGSSSPVNMLSSNFADELKIATQGQSKVIGVSIKNRGAILPSGHFPDGAYWFDTNSGNFVTSTYYTDKLPDWVSSFNSQKLPQQYMSQKWETLLPITEYTESGPDQNPYEGKLGGSTTFPYDLKKIWRKDKNYSEFRTTPFGNTIVAEMAKAALKGESMGKDAIPDLLTVSFSSTDVIGHRFGPDSKEIEDCYIRLDKDLAEFLDYLDEQVGKGEYVLFLTADHAVAQVPQFLIDKKVPAGYIKSTPLTKILLQSLNERYGKGDWLLSGSNDQLFIDKKLVREREIDLDQFLDDVIEIMMTFQGIKNVFKAEDMKVNEYTKGIKSRLQNGYNAKRSGDLLLVYEPGWFATGYGKTGTTHGSGYNYDTHVPLLIYGTGIPAGMTSFDRLSITDIIPTLCLKYQINLPNGANGQPIQDLLK